MKKRNKKDAALWQASARDMLYLTACSIHTRVPAQERVAQMDLKKVFALSRSQSLEAMTYMALEPLLKGNDAVQNDDLEQILTKWEECKNKAIRKTLLMDNARGQLFSYLEEKKIWHLALKGVILCRMYPAFGMRQMADNDILFDASFRNDVRDWFVTHGYTVESFEESNHDEYHKEPIYNFEMHTALFCDSAYPQLSQYYLSIKNRLCPAAGKSFEYHMTDEDFYIYLLAHTYKHYSGNGVGLRSLLDLYVYHTAKANLDWRYLDGELAKIGLHDFEKEMRELSMKVFAPEFDGNSLSETEQKMLHKLLFDHTYGTIENYWRNQVKKMQPEGKTISGALKMKYLLKRVYPSKEYMEGWCQMYAPFFLKNKALIPAARIWRLVRISRENRKIIQREFNTVRKM